MIDALYNYRQGDIHSAEFSDEFNKLCIPFEDSLNEEQIDVFHKLLDCVSETAAAEMRAAFKNTFALSILTYPQKQQSQTGVCCICVCPQLIIPSGKSILVVFERITFSCNC